VVEHLIPSIPPRDDPAREWSRGGMARPLFALLPRSVRGQLEGARLRQCPIDG